MYKNVGVYIILLVFFCTFAIIKRDDCLCVLCAAESLKSYACLYLID